MAPGLLALYLLDHKPELDLLLLLGDVAACGEALEPVVETALSDSLRALIAPFVVASWPGYVVSRDGEAVQHDSPVLLLDPVQLWLELQDRVPGDAIRTACNGIVRQGNRLSWSGGAAEAADFLNLAGLTKTDEQCEILGIEQVRKLTLPVLADLDSERPEGEGMQLLPLGDERVFMRRRRCTGDPEDELINGFAALLYQLTGG